MSIHGSEHTPTHIYTLLCAQRDADTNFHADSNAHVYNLHRYTHLCTPTHDLLRMPMHTPIRTYRFLGNDQNADTKSRTSLYTRVKIPILMFGEGVYTSTDSLAHRRISGEPHTTYTTHTSVNKSVQPHADARTETPAHTYRLVYISPMHTLIHVRILFLEYTRTCTRPHAKP